MRDSGNHQDMTTTIREVERKYDASEATYLPEWPELVEFGSPAGPDDEVLRATYFDTEDLRLLRAGLTLRHRTGGEDAGWHLKLPAGPDARDEVRLAAGAPRKGSPPPAQLRALTRSVTRGAVLAPVATITTARRRWRWTDESGRAVLEVVDDRVTAQRTGAGAAPEAWRELEVELGVDADPALLDRLDHVLADAGVRRSGSTSKLGRVLGGPPSAEPRPRTEDLDAGSSIGDVALAYLGEQADAIARLDPAVRRDVPDAVHQMRVATRRMRSALQAFGTVVDRDRTREVADELKWLGAVLGNARDLEVLRARISDAVAALPVEDVLGPVQARVTRFFAGREGAARGELLAALDGDRYLALLQGMDRLLADPPLTPGASRRARKALPDVLGRAERRIARHMRAAGADGPDRDVELHEARKAGKRLRYAAEAAEPVLGKGAGRVVTRVKEFQDVLGEHQDMVVARPLLRELAVGAYLDGESPFTFGVLYGREETQGHLPEREVAEQWRGVRRALKRATP
jgi:CHAD domain-containing protein